LPPYRWCIRCGLRRRRGAIQPKDGWYTKALVDFDFMRQNVSIPPKKGV
jgi:hypothetical protein